MNKKLQIGNRKSEIKNPPWDPILLAVTGMSPAVLTETVWALAQEQPPLIPRRVTIVTTTAGQKQIERELFRQLPEYDGLTVWEALRHSVLAGKPELNDHLVIEDCRIMGRANPHTGRLDPIDDLRTPAENEAAADFIMEEVRKITANDDSQLIASLAGGRKTMSALLYACLSLLGRAQDRLTHVLVNEPFENPGLCPKFYFPTTPPQVHQLLDRQGQVRSKHSAQEAHPQLADVPFVRLRNLFPKQIGKFPGRFIQLVHLYSEQIHSLSGLPSVKLNAARQWIVVQDVPVSVCWREFALYAFLYERCQQQRPDYPSQKEAVTDFSKWLKVWASTQTGTEAWDMAGKWQVEEEDLRKQISSLRAKFKANGLAPYWVHLLPQRHHFGIHIRSG